VIQVAIYFSVISSAQNHTSIFEIREYYFITVPGNLVVYVAQTAHLIRAAP
jgi:hypothetical protein